MKIKLMKHDGSSQLYDCEDVTVTYYTEGTAAYQDALENWNQQLQSLKSTVKLQQSNLEAARAHFREVEKQLRTVEEVIASRRDNASQFNRLLWRVPFIACRVAREDARFQAKQQQLNIQIQTSRQQVTRINGEADRAVATLQEFESDPLTPGMELAIRLRGRSLVRVGLPSHGDVAYVMNDQGKTIDKFEWPLKSIPAALRAG